MLSMLWILICHLELFLYKQALGLLHDVVMIVNTSVNNKKNNIHLEPPSRDTLNERSQCVLQLQNKENLSKIYPPNPVLFVALN